MNYDDWLAIYLAFMRSMVQEGWRYGRYVHRATSWYQEVASVRYFVSEDWAWQYYQEWGRAPTLMDLQRGGGLAYG